MKFAKFPKFALLFAIAGALTLTLAGCGAAVSNLAITPGNWAITATSTAPAKGNLIATTFVLGGNLTESGANLAGTMFISQSVCITPQTISFTGTVKGSNITLTSASFDGQVITVTASGTKDSWTGTYAVTGECADSGTITASKVPSISGTWNGTLSNVAMRTKGNGIAEATLSVALTQATTASEDGTFALSGTLTYTNSVCSVSGTISSGSLAGNFIQINGSTLDTDDSEGAFSYTDVLLDSITAPQNMTGTYDVVFSDVCQDQIQSLTLTKQ